jgi:hypothetical protein
MQEIQPTDTCARCGLRRATRETEEKGKRIRLCDDCYWGQEPGTVVPPAKQEPSTTA